MLKILYLPTRYFPSISGAEFYMQRIAEIFSSTYNYQTDIYTSNAIDFKALRSREGKVIKQEDKYFRTINNLKINRFPIEYNISIDKKMEYIKNISFYHQLNLSDDCLRLFLKNGPFLLDLIRFFLILRI